MLDFRKRSPHIGRDRTDGLLRKPRPMLDAIEPLLLDAALECAAVENCRGRVAVECVKAEDGHLVSKVANSQLLSNQRHSIGRNAKNVVAGDWFLEWAPASPVSHEKGVAVCGKSLANSEP